MSEPIDLEKLAAGLDKIMSRSDERIAEQMAVAFSRIGFSKVEHAFWVLIYSDRSREPSWISAVGQHDGLSLSIRLPGMVVYHPTEEMVAELLAAMRTCDCVIHVHNHPVNPYPGVTGSSTPSKEDHHFANSWRWRLPEVADKMKFFIVHGNEIVEYL